MKKVLIGVLLLGAVMMAGTVGLVWWAVNDTETIEPETLLVLSVGQELGASEGAEPVPFFGEGGMTLRELIRAVDRASMDDRIGGILLDGGFPAMSLADMQELRAALNRFRDTDRPVTAFAESYGNGGYFLASAADRIALVPVGAVDLRGLVARPMFVAGMLEKLGIEAEFEHAGKYKSAAEMLTREEMSEPAEQAMNELLDSLYDQFVRGISEGRAWESDHTLSVIDGGPYEGSNAYEVGVVDTLVYQDEVGALFDFLDGMELDDVEMIYPEDYLLVELPEQPEVLDRSIALIYGVGQIVSGGGDDSIWDDGSDMTSGEMVDAISAARQDEDVEAIVLRVDSPGGSGLASDVIWREVALAAERVPVIVSMGSVAASGGYYISCPADEIFADPATITGSIGVVGGKLSMAGLNEKIGVSNQVVKRGRNADFFNANRSFTEEERKEFRDWLLSFYDVFVERVAAGRDSDYESVHEVAQGRVWTGEQALEIGLVDHLGGITDAIGRAKELIGVDRDDLVHLHVYPKEEPFVDKLLSGGLFNSMINSKLHRYMNEAMELYGLGDSEETLRVLQTLEQGDPLLLLPIQVDVD